MSDTIPDRAVICRHQQPTCLTNCDHIGPHKENKRCSITCSVSKTICASATIEDYA